MLPSITRAKPEDDTTGRQIQIMIHLGAPFRNPLISTSGRRKPTSRVLILEASQYGEDQLPLGTAFGSLGSGLRKGDMVGLIESVDASINGSVVPWHNWEFHGSWQTVPCLLRDPMTKLTKGANSLKSSWEGVHPILRAKRFQNHLVEGRVQSEMRKWIIPRCRTIVSLIVEGLISEIVWLELVHETSKCKWNLRGKPAQCLLASRSRSVDLSGLDRIKSFCNRRFQLPPVTCLLKSCCQWREAIVRYLRRFKLNYKPLCIFSEDIWR